MTSFTLAGVPVIPDGRHWRWALGQSWTAELIDGRVAAYHVTAEVWAILTGERDA